MLFVVDPDAARIALRARAISCPQEDCAGRLRPWSPARPRTVTVWLGEQARLVPDRGRCGACRVTQTLLPAWYVPRRSAGIEVIGVVITGFVNYGHRADRIAAALRMPRSTVRAWVRGLADASPVFGQLAVHIGLNLGAVVRSPQSPKQPVCTAATKNAAGALDQLANAAHALTTPDSPHTATGPTGIDYIYLLGKNARVEYNQPLRLVDPSNARTTLGLWPAINLAAGPWLGRFHRPRPARPRCVTERSGSWWWRSPRTRARWP